MINAQEAKSKSYISLERIGGMIIQKTANNETCLPYVLISHETAEALRRMGYNVTENLGGGFGIPKGVSTIKW